MTKNIKKNNFIWLTIALIGMFLTGAIAQDFPNYISINILQLSSVFLMVVSLRSLQKDRASLVRWITIISITLLIVLIGGVTENYYVGYAYLVLLLVFYLSAAWLVGSQVLLTGSIDINKIIGSVALYFLLGLIFSIFYTILLEFAPDAMNGVEAGRWADNMVKMSYFSFVTLTTLGFGDINPATPTAQALVVLEAITGMFYLAIIVASLIGSMRHDKTSE